MARWRDVEGEAPELAAMARACFDAHLFKTLATLRKDGSPRISGVEVEFRDGDLYMGSMWKGIKALDLRRDPRFALHSTAGPVDTWTADAKVAGRLLEEPPPEGPRREHRFRADLTEVVVVHLDEARERLLIDSWHPGRGTERRTR